MSEHDNSMIEYGLRHDIPDSECQALCDWARACGLAPNEIPADATFRIADGMVEVEVYARDADGKRRPDPREPNRAMRTTQRVPLAAPFPIVKKGG